MLARYHVLQGVLAGGLLLVDPPKRLREHVRQTPVKRPPPKPHNSSARARSIAFVWPIAVLSLSAHRLEVVAGRVLGEGAVQAAGVVRPVEDLFGLLGFGFFLDLRPGHTQ